MSSLPRPLASSSRTWLIGSSGAPNRERVLRTPLARRDLAVVLGQQHDDPVGLTQPVRAQHDRGVPVQRRAHGTRMSVETAETAVAVGKGGRRHAPGVGRRKVAPGTLDEDQLAVGQLPHQRRWPMR